MARKFYTIDDLYAFCKENHFASFSSAKQGAPLIVQSLGTFESDNMSTEGLMNVKLKSCHTGKNRNKSGISDDKMKMYKHTFKGRPILGAIYKTDTGEYEFRAHDMKVVENGDETDVEFIEQPIGVISQTEEPYLEFDEEEQKNYLMVSGTIFSDYSKAADILERRRTCKCSVEIAVEEMSYNGAEDYLSIDKFHFCGVTILGYEQDGVTEIQEGMVGSKITIDDFSNKNSMFAANCQDKLIEVLEKLNMTLESFNNTNQNSEKGGEKVMNKFEELCSKYNKTADEVTFEYDNLSDEELEVAFKEAFEEVENEPVVNEEQVIVAEITETVVEEIVDDEPAVVEEVVTEPVEESVEQPKESFVLKYELSHDDIRTALYSLLAATAEDEYYYAWILEVYDDKFIYHDAREDKFYRQDYSKDGDNVALGEDKVEVFNEWLSKSEKEALDVLKAQYVILEKECNELKAFKMDTEAAQLQAQKDAIFANPMFANVIETKSFKTLMENSKEYTVEECEQKAHDILDDFNSFAVNFAENESTPKSKTLGFNFNAKPSKKKTAYGGLFDKDE